ncbi:MAG TPA: isoprenylcysteine carboxylmethyltransferase family protein [Tepidisphaeraceae bacterium]|jgi:protein-S-isoprenylcysteine O-methyltransferase Ste14|nr:isoprenylcysteine carboxylmethyltransferase family protein [Tepidisphaeraceae bacterium]
MLQRIPPFLLGVVLAAYWGRVLRMAYKARRRTGRAANLVPGERLGRMLRVVWAPAVALWVVHPFLTALVRYPPRLLRPLYSHLAVSWTALAIAAACLGLTLVCWKKMGRAWRMGIDPSETTPLIATGPFAYVRHPIYALSQTMMFATIAMIPTPLMLVAAGVHIALLQWESRREEGHLLRVHGEPYARYRAAVGRFVPRSLGPYCHS